MGTKTLKFVFPKLATEAGCWSWARLSRGFLWYGSCICSHTFLLTDWDTVREAAPRFKYLGMILNSLLMWIHWFCHRHASNFPFDPVHIKALKCSSKGFVPLRRSAGDFLRQTHSLPNRLTFGLEITGQTNEFNELSQTQWMPLAIWTQIKGYGQVSRPFQGGLYTNVTESSRFSVCADKLLKVPRMSVVVPLSALLPFCSPFCVCCSFMRSLTSTKARNAKRSCDVCLISLSDQGSAVWPTSEGHHCRPNKAQTWPATSSDADSLLHPPFRRFAFLTLSSSLPSFNLGLVRPSSLSLPAALLFWKRWCFPTGFTWWTISNPKGDKGVFGKMAEFCNSAFA